MLSALTDSGISVGVRANVGDLSEYSPVTPITEYEVQAAAIEAPDRCVDYYDL